MSPGHIAVVHDPLRTLSVLEPGGPGGCEKSQQWKRQQWLVVACMSRIQASLSPLLTSVWGMWWVMARRYSLVLVSRMPRSASGRMAARCLCKKRADNNATHQTQTEKWDDQTWSVSVHVSVTGRCFGQVQPFCSAGQLMWLLRNGKVYINQSLQVKWNNMVGQGKAARKNQIQVMEFRNKCRAYGMWTYFNGAHT